MTFEESPPIAARTAYVRPLGPRASLPVPGVLKAPIHARQEVCSGRCRAARSRQRKVAARRERDAEIRALLEVALEKMRGGP